MERGLGGEDLMNTKITPESDEFAEFCDRMKSFRANLRHFTPSKPPFARLVAIAVFAAFAIFQAVGD